MNVNTIHGSAPLIHHCAYNWSWVGALSLGDRGPVSNHPKIHPRINKTCALTVSSWLQLALVLAVQFASRLSTPRL